MSTRRRFSETPFTFIIVGALLLAGCTNPLLTLIEDTVAVVVAPPEVLSIFPLADAENVAVNLSNISVTFSKEIRETQAPGTLKVTSSGGTEITGLPTVSSDTITFAPNEELTYSTTYTVTISGLMDVDGNSLPEAYAWSFTTGLAPDTEAPTGTSIVIQNGAEWTTTAVVSIVLEASDSYGVAQMKVYNDGNSSADWTTYVTTLDWTLSDGDGEKTVYVRFRDGAGNETDVTKSDTILLDSTPPDITAFQINDFTDDGASVNKTNQTTTTISISSADNGNQASGPHQYRIRNSGGSWSSWDSLSLENSVGSVRLTGIALSAEEGQEETLEGQVIDLAGNTSLIASAAIVYETTAPTIIASWPDASTVNSYPANAGKIYVAFSEDMDQFTILSTDVLFLRQGTTDIKGTSIAYFSESTPVPDSDELPEFRLEVYGLSLTQFTDYTMVVDISVQDLAGNALTEEFTFPFNTSEAFDTEPPTGAIVLDEAQATHFTDTVTSDVNLSLAITASDTYNALYGLKIWGDNDGSIDPDTLQLFPYFEENAIWEPYPLTNSKAWVVSPADGIKYLYYRFMDNVQNATSTPYRLKVVLDTTYPAVNAVSIDNDAEYTNEPGRLISIATDATDFATGSGITKMMVSELPDFSDTAWVEWSDLVVDWPLSAGDGPKTIYVKVQDFVEHDSTDPLAVPVAVVADYSDTIISDITGPEIIFDPAVDYLTVNTATAQTGSISDPTAGIDTYAWTLDAGPGTSLTFSDAAIANPTVNVPDNIDGEYTLRVTVTDLAGNTNFSTVPFVWDTSPPDDIQNISFVDANSDSFSYYTNTAQPTVSWDASAGASTYRVAFTLPDWENPAFVDYEELGAPAISAPPPATYGDNDGTVLLYVTAWDDAGNRSDQPGTGATATLYIDTRYPYISNDGQLFLTNIARTIDYGSGGDGQVYDINHADDPAPEAGRENTGSGIETISWSGPPQVTFDDPSSLSPLVSATPDVGDFGQYEIALTATDYAGNATIAAFTFVWDQELPTAPTVSGFAHTPNVTPTWSWTSGGGGNGEFRYRMERAPVDSDDADNGSPESATYGQDLGAIEQVFDWTAPLTTTSYRPDATSTPATPTTLDDEYRYILYVQERDDAGNWSGDSSYSIWIEGDFTSEPYVIREGAYLRSASETLVTWNWSSGAGFSSIEDNYRYSIDNGVTWTEIANNSVAIDLNYAEGLHTLQVEEQNISNSSWFGKIASSTAMVDTMAPGAPSVASETRTNDTTPTWTWTSGTGDGIGQYQYSIDGGSTWAETTATYYTHTTALSNESVMTVQVGERDEAGNWSTSGSSTTTVDTVAPVLTSVFLDGGAPNSASRTVNVAINIDSAGDPGPAVEMSHYQRFTSGTEAWSGYVPVNTSFNQLFNTDGTVYYWVQLKDAAGNVCNYQSDSIVIDTVPPAISDFSINSGATYSSSASVTLSSTVSDATTYVQYMRFANGSDPITSAGWISYSSSYPWTLSAGGGAKKVTAQYKDFVGNITTTVSDSIFYGSPSLKYATKGETNNGTITVYYNAYTEEVGTNSYSIYYNTDLGSSRTLGTTTTNDVSASVSGLTKGTIYYFYVDVANSAIGAPTPQTGGQSGSVYYYGYSSDAAIVYSAASSTDEAIAQNIKTTLAHDFSTNSFRHWYNGATYSTSDYVEPYNYEGGYREAVYTATLVPDHLIYNGSAADDRYRVYGDPIFVTPGSTIGSYYYRSWHVAAEKSGKGGIIAMGLGGRNFLYLAAYYFNSWGLAGQSPAEITRYGSVEYKETASTTQMYQWTTSNYHWYYPLQMRILAGGSFAETNPTHNALMTMSYTALDQSRYLIQRPGGANPPGGAIIARDTTTKGNDYFSILRQGRFAYYAYGTIADRAYTGLPFFKNIVWYMKQNF